LLELRHEFYLAREALDVERHRQLGHQDLDHDVAAEGLVTGDKHKRHPPATELALDGVIRAEGALELHHEVGRVQSSLRRRSSNLGNLDRRKSSSVHSTAWMALTLKCIFMLDVAA